MEDSTASTLLEPTDLRTKGLCLALCQPTPHNSQHEKAQPSPGCLGYLDTGSQETLRHSFYASATLQETYRDTPSPTVTSMNQLVLSQPAETSLTIVDQLKIAHSLASAVLKFHSTPWLREYFSLSDLFLFHDASQNHPDLSASLQTLHLSLTFIQPTPPSTHDSPMEGVEPHPHPSEIQPPKLHHPIRNLPLWSLGTALLQIGQWSRQAPPPNHVLAIRKLISSTQIPPLGPKYKELTKKCLDCDFGYGDDLSKPRLQQAVYENLICELGDMIGSLDIS